MTDEEFSAIPLQTILKLGVLQCNLYLKLPTGRFVRLFSSGDVFDKNDSDRLSLKQIDSLYVKNSDAALFLKQTIQNIKGLASSGISDPLDSIRLSEETLDMIAEFNQKLGLTAEVQALVQQTSLLAIESIRQNSPTPILWKKITSEMGRLPYSHSITLGWISCGIASMMDWDSETTFHKLILASILHDLTVSDFSLLFVQTDRDLLELNRQHSEQEVYSYFQHPINSSQLSRLIPGTPSDVDQIIIEHHERPDGSGFPNHLTSQQIHPLSAIHIIAEEMLHSRIKNPNEFDVVKFLNDLPESYRSGPFKKVVRCITEKMAYQR